MNGSRSHIIFIFGFTYTYFHLIQITGNIHSSLKRQRRFQNGYMIFKIHIQSLLSPYSSFITIYRHLKWINKNTTVINNYINRNTIKYILLFIFKHQHLWNFGKGLTIHQHQTVPFYIHGRTQSRYTNIHIWIQTCLCSHIKLNPSFKRSQHRYNGIHWRYKIYQLSYIYIPNFKVKACISSSDWIRTIYHNRLHISIQCTHFQIS